MAEIRIEEKKKNWLPWLLGLLGLVLLAWLAVDVFDKDGEPELATADEVNFPDADLREDRADNDVKWAKEQNTDEAAMGEFDKNWDGINEDYNANVIYYISSVENLDAEMNLDHDYSNIALKALANSLVALSREKGMAQDLNVQAKSKKIKSQAEQITENWKSTKHADMIRNAALSSADLLKDIQKEKFPNMRNEVMEVEKAAMKIKSGTLTLEQKEDVKNFFRITAKVLEKMREA